MSSSVSDSTSSQSLENLHRQFTGAAAKQKEATDPEQLKLAEKFMRSEENNEAMRARRRSACRQPILTIIQSSRAFRETFLFEENKNTKNTSV